ncbi:MAG TPA: hypothetical protein VGF49_03540 [Candidatus Solibacter sp.]
MRYTRHILLLAAAAALHARSAPGDRYIAAARAFEARQQWDSAVAGYRAAVAQDPSEILYRMALDKAVFQAAEAHMKLGRDARTRGDLETALREFGLARELSPGLTAAAQELAITREMILANTTLTPLQRVKQSQQRQLDRILPAPELVSAGPALITLTLGSQSPKVIFETVARYAGVNVVFDPEYQPGRNLSLQLEGVTLDQALDQAAMLTKSFWKALSSNSIFVTNDNPAKRRDYEEQVTKIFYLSNVNTPQEVQEIINVVRSIVDLQRVMPYSTQFAIVVRGETDKVALAAKLINGLDKPRSEVVVDILVLEASQVFTRQITAAIASTGLNVPVTFAPRAALQSTATTVPLASLGRLSSSDFAVTLPGALLQAALSDAGTRVMQAPQLRAVDSVKATLKIGDRQPTATGSFSSASGTAAVNALVNTQFTYIDVGVNVDLTPRVHDNGDVSLHVELEVSSVNGHVTLGGIDEPIIGQRKVVHDVRMRAGEVSILAGLTTQQDTKTTTGVPGLSGIPILRRLFSGENVDRQRGELMIAIIPHIVRAPEVTPENTRTVSVGTAATTKLTYEKPQN